MELKQVAQKSNTAVPKTQYCLRIMKKVYGKFEVKYYLILIYDRLVRRNVSVNKSKK